MLGGFGLLLLGCQKAPPEVELAEPVPISDVLKTEIVEVGGEKRVRLTVIPFPNSPDPNLPVTLKLSHLFYRGYETTEALPVEEKFSGEATWQGDFAFPAAAWEGKVGEEDEGIECEIYISSPFFTTESEPRTHPTPTVSVDSAGVTGMKFAAKWDHSGPARPYEVRITSIRGKKDEYLSRPIEFVVKPGESKPVPGEYPDGELDVHYWVRQVPNKRWIELYSIWRPTDGR